MVVLKILELISHKKERLGALFGELIKDYKPAKGTWRQEAAKYL